MKTKIHISIILSLAVLSFNFANAQDFWQQLPGPEGGTVRCYAIDGTGKTYIGSYGSGVYYSTNNGSSWVQTVQGIVEGRINTLGVTSGNYVFAATDRALYRSTDSGVSWVTIAFQNVPVYSLVIDASNRIFVSAQNTVQVSTDNGVTWAPSGNGLPGSNTLYSLTIAPNGNMYVRTSSSVFRSTDNGANWAAINNGLQLGYTSALNALPNNTLLCGISSTGVFRSTDNGNNWALANSGITDNRINCFGGNASYIYTGTATGVFRSSNYGDNWVQMNSGITNPYIGVNVIFYSSNNLFAGTGGIGILKSTNDGQNWVRSNSGLNACAVKSVAFTPSGNIVAGLTGGVFVSSDNGISWIQSDAGITNTLLNVVRVHPNGTFFAGSFPLTGTPLSGVFRSTNNGQNWTVAMSGFTYNYNNVLDFVFNSAGDIFTGTNDNVYKSTNNGDNWFRANNGLTNNQVYALAINQSGTLFAGTYGGGMFRSTNDGNSWTAINNGLTTTLIMNLTINPSGYIFAGTYASGVFRSKDNGDSWEQVLSATTLQTWSVSSNSAGHIFAGVLGGLFTDLGCWRSTNDGDNWEHINSGLFDTFVQSLGVSSSGYVFAGTFGGLFRSVGPTIGIISSNNEVPKSFVLYQNYPNPFNPVTKIGFSIPPFTKGGAGGFVTLKIYDLLGREIVSLIPPLRGGQEGLSPGTYEVTWDGRNYPSGVYFYKLIAGDYSETKKMMLIK
jgi:photosystem II stability/assembly factor-like uncharacterized protein